MFGLEGQSREEKQRKDKFVFDLEREMQDPKQFRSTKEKVEKRIQSIKTILRGGGDKETFDTLGVLLHGYTSLMKVVNRSLKKK